MRQVLHRRFAHYQSGDAGFDIMPDALLIDGGVEHTNVVVDELASMGLTVPTFGMVKDDRHRTRALVTPDGHEISISTNPAVFAFIGTIQEEVHRFAIQYHRLLRSKRMQASQLEKIEGVGPKRREALLKKFRSVSGIRNAELSQLRELLPEKAADAVWRYFHNESNEEEPPCE